MNTIAFPGLWGLKITISRVAFSIFGINIYWYGIIIAAAFLLAVLLGLRSSKKYGMDPDNIIDLVIFAAPAAIICARLYYVIFSWDLYKDNLLDVFNTRKGGLAIYGGVIGALATAYIYCRIKKIRFLELFDFVVPYIVMAQGIGRWGNFVNQEAYGVNTTLPWGMTSEKIRSELSVLNIPGVNPDLPVHPTFLYESLWDLGVFLFLIWFRKRKKVSGEVFFLYAMLYGAGRAFIEGLRTDSLMLGGVRVSQLLSIVFVIAFGVAFYMRRKNYSMSVEEEAPVGHSEYGVVLEKLKNETENSGDQDNVSSEVENDRENGSPEDVAESEINDSRDGAHPEESSENGSKE